MSGIPAEKTQRLFVACDFPDEVRHEVADWQRREFDGRDELRVNHSLHLTLAFLGDVSVAQVSRVAEALAAVPVSSARAELGDVLFLPRHGSPRVVAVEVRDLDGALSRLQAAVRSALTATGLYNPDERPWLSHVTVARFHGPGHPFHLQNVNIAEFCVVRMVLYSSDLERGGAVHVPVKVFSAS